MSLLPHFKRVIPSSLLLLPPSTLFAPVQCISYSSLNNKLPSPQGGSLMNRWNLISSRRSYFYVSLLKLKISPWWDISWYRYLNKPHLTRISAWQSFKQKPSMFIQDLGIDLVPVAIEAIRNSRPFSITIPASTVHSF